MSLHKRIGVVVLWAASIVAAGAWAQAPVAPPPSLQAPTVLSGNDLGFRVERWKGDRPVGTLVAKVDGRWIEVEFSAGMKLLTVK